MKHHIKLLSLFAILVCKTSLAQTTSIPDENFEQALIYLNIDSDGVVNGQVLTADIENIVELDLSNVYHNFDTDFIISDFTGIEDFESLEILTISHLWVELSEDKADVFNSNFNLKEFRADVSSVDTDPFISIPYLDFSNLQHLEYISLVNSDRIYSINLANPDTSYENLTIDLYHEYWDPPNNTYTVCLNVNDAQAASSDQFPYSTWNIITPAPDANGYVWRDYNFSSTCTLSISNIDLESNIKLYPNPVRDNLWIENPNQIQIDKAEVYTIAGKKVDSFSSVNDYIDVESLEDGIYFVKLYSKHSSTTVKVLKK